MSPSNSSAIQVLPDCVGACPATKWNSAVFTLVENFRKIRGIFKISNVANRNLTGDIARPCNRIEWSDGEVWVRHFDCTGKQFHCCTEHHKCGQGMIYFQQNLFFDSFFVVGEGDCQGDNTCIDGLKCGVYNCIAVNAFLGKRTKEFYKNNCCYDPKTTKCWVIFTTLICNFQKRFLILR